MTLPHCQGRVGPGGGPGQAVCPRLLSQGVPFYPFPVTQPPKLQVSVRGAYFCPSKVCLCLLANPLSPWFHWSGALTLPSLPPFPLRYSYSPSRFRACAVSSPEPPPVPPSLSERPFSIGAHSLPVMLPALPWESLSGWL